MPEDVERTIESGDELHRVGRRKDGDDGGRNGRTNGRTDGYPSWMEDELIEKPQGK